MAFDCRRIDALFACCLLTSLHDVIIVSTASNTLISSFAIYIYYNDLFARKYNFIREKYTSP